MMGNNNDVPREELGEEFPTSDVWTYYGRYPSVRSNEEAAQWAQAVGILKRLV